MKRNGWQVDPDRELRRMRYAAWGISFGAGLVVVGIIAKAFGA